MKPLALALLLTAAPALAQTPQPHSLTMTGHGEVKAAPDQVEITAGVTTSAPTAAAALAANTARMKTVLAALQKLGVPDKNLQTSNFSVSPQYSNPNNETPRVTGYQVSNSVSVRLDDVGRLGAALDTLVTAGANQMNGIAFSIREPAPMLKAAREQAVADAKMRAETYARAAGVTLGPILSVSEGGGDGPRPLPKVIYMARAAGPVPVAAGEESVSADVSIVWEIH